MSVPALGAVSYAAPDSDKGDKPAHAGKPADKPGAKGKPADRPVEPAKPEKREKAEKPAKPAKAEKPAKPAKPESTPANPGKSEAAKDAKNNPPGNNGTVKIAGPADIAGHPSNNPHPGCTFLVEWYGFDEGDDIVSSVTFASQAPTADVAISPASDSVFVGGDAAGGGTDLDGREAYTLSFDGEPHPKQGYHVKLTVNTPYSHGSDKKSKVFWVEPCESEAPSTEGEDEDEDSSSTPGVNDETETDTDTDTTVEETDTDESTDENDEDTTVVVEDTESTTTDGGAPAVEVLGVELFSGGDTGTPATVAPEAARAAAPVDAAEVPTSVDAGLAAFGDFARSPLPLALAGLGAAAALGGVAYRRRVAGQ